MAEPADRLSSVLRDKLGLQGTKIGCNAGDCGSCSVLIDGEVVCSCLTAVAQVQHSKITTIEGLAMENGLSNLQKSFKKHGASQCGICTPGMLIAAHALLQQNTNPTRHEVENALGGVLCRCTGYRKIIDAVMHANETIGEELKPCAGENVGSAIEHLDANLKLNGTLCYGADQIPDNAVAVRVIRSPYHFANFILGDYTDFLQKHPFIEAVFDASDIKGRNCFGVIPDFADQPVFAEGRARFRGEAIAAIVGEREAIAAFDENKFPVQWDVLGHSLTPTEAMSSQGQNIHLDREGNILVRGLVEKGDVNGAFADARYQVDVSITTPFVEHAYIEPEAGYATREGDRIILSGCTQAAQMDREVVAVVMGLDKDAIRIIPSACGGGFGSKLDISFQPYIALAAWNLNRPAFICYTRSESMRSTTKRHPSEISVSIGCDEYGKIAAFRFDGTFNTGAYSSWGPTVANRVPVHACGPYYLPNYRADSVAVYCNTAPAGAFRGFGVPQAAIAQETAFDQLADQAGIDRLQFRQINALENGQATATGQIFEQGVGIGECFKALESSWHAANLRATEFNNDPGNTTQRYGVGIGACWYGCGNTSLPNPSTVRMGITSTAKVVLHQGAMDIGQGSNTVITQIAADALGVPVHAIYLIGGDTDLTPDCGKTSASRQTYVTGAAAKLAGESLRSQLLEYASSKGANGFTTENGKVVLLRQNQTQNPSFNELEENAQGYVLMVEETYDPPTSALDEKGQGIPYAVYGYGAQIIELSVDNELGTTKLHQITTAHDVGRAINPMLVEGQIEGGVAQGIGMALMEEFQPGITENLHDYLIPTCGDMPDFKHHIIEVEDGEGPYGAKGLGEHVLIPTAPAILNAIRDASGAVISDLPATPERVLHAIKSKQE